MRTEVGWRERLVFDGPAALYVVAVFIGASIPVAPNVGLGILSFDKVQHLLAFGGMQLLVHRAFRHERLVESDRGNLWIAALVCVGVGAFIELWQAALPFRSGEWGDLLADVIGVLLATGLILFLDRYRARRQPIP